MTRACWVLVAAVLGLILSGCGNWISVTDAGQMGLTVDGAGRPVVAVLTCARATPVVDLSQGRRPSDPDDQVNVARGSWRAARAYAGVERLALESPSAAWRTVRPAGRLEAGQLFVVDGGTVEDDDASLGGVTFRAADLTRLSPSTVEVNGKVVSWRAFRAYRCA